MSVPEGMQRTTEEPLQCPGASMSDRSWFLGLLKKELVPRLASLLNGGIRMDDMNAGSWRRAGMHAGKGQGFFVGQAARVITCGRGNVENLIWPLLTCNPTCQ
jgi:hypothetical protein